MALGQNRKILQIVGYQNSGKTTFVGQLITRATAEGLVVGTIKHHGHGGIPSVESSKDSARHELAGACVTAVEGQGMLRMSMKRPHWQLAEILAMYESFQLDVILVEGYKNEDYPKVVLLRQAEDRVLLQQVNNIVCVLYWPTYPMEETLAYPTFSLDETARYMDFLMQEMRREE